MERLSVVEWNAMSPEEQKTHEAEMPWEIFADLSKKEQDRLTNITIEKDRKLKAALQQVSELDSRIKALEASGAPRSQIANLEEIKRNFQDEYEKDPTMAIARLTSQGIQFALNQKSQIDGIKKQALRKIKKEYPKDYEKYGDELEDKLDLVSGPISVDDVVVMFNALRGKSIDDQIKEAEERGRKKALEDAGVVAVDGGGSSGSEGKPSSLSKEQQDECNGMGLTEKDYKEILRDRQEKDKLEGRSPRTLISPKH